MPFLIHFTILILMADCLENLGLDSLSLPTFQSSYEATPQGQVRRYIDGTLASSLGELCTLDGRPAITLKRRSGKMSLFINPTNGALESDGTETHITYTWPGANAHEARKFTIIFRILAIITDAVNTGLVVSRRDIYYNDPTCFGTQRIVDTVIDDLAYTIGVDRAALNVEAAAKGLVAGSYRTLTKPGEPMVAHLSTKDSLVPSSQEIGEIDVFEASWVLIIEKEAVYRRLARSEYYTRAAAGKGILITGKGYPDLSTRAFVRKIFEDSHRLGRALTFYALVDSDPDGMAIMSTYKYGSMAHTSQNGRLNITRLRWLGLRTSEVVTGASNNDDEALIRLTARDRKKIITMLSNNPVWMEEGPELEWRAELQQMLMLNLKAEIEILYDRDGGLEGWVDRKMESFSLQQDD
ncbi:putative meiosis-specific topoisomerase Spo11 [Aspergillus alliaceus]|uniref:putative meiosis-specific topoisomerase Spo11 n=1 Tax=Petromyces alliaceus TaxID=209559 RepID=UPI0012A5EC71|nr:meiotic recombination protein spo11 [Aspergillus alliaceus]KAB8234655.1 meiotic recombination protein spo11 [Aspergillus alliaceus]